MWHRIAARQARTVAEAQATNSARDFAELCALWELEPWGPERDAIHAAQIVKTLAEALGGARLARPIEDYAVRFGAPRQTPEDMRRALRLAAHAAGVNINGDDR
jgi:hypothetical protein